MTADFDQADLEQVVAGLRAAGWRSSEERLQTTAAKRLATARHHQQQADFLRTTAETFAVDAPRLYRHWIEQALRHEVRAAERSGAVMRAVRQVAFRLVSTWTGDGQQLLAVAQAVSQTPDVSATAALDTSAAEAGARPHDHGVSDASHTMTP